MPEARLSKDDLDHMLVCAEADFRALAKAQLLVTGGTGYIGRWLLEALCHANRSMALDLNITVLTRNPPAFLAAHPHFSQEEILSLIKGDIRNFSLPARGFTHVIHAATDVIAENSPLETFDVTVLGTRHLLDCCRQQQISRVLLLSSGAVYGRIPASIERIPEDFNGAPRTDHLASAYGLGKMATEWLGTAFASDTKLQCVSARVFAQVGPFLALDKQFAAGNFLKSALRGQPFIIKGDGTPRRSYMYGADLVVWLLRILLRGESCRAYNVGSDYAISIEELACAIAQFSGVPHPEIQIQTRRAPGALPEYYVPDISRAKNELGLEITIPFDDALRRTIAWYRSYSTRR